MTFQVQILDESRHEWSLTRADQVAASIIHQSLTTRPNAADDSSQLSAYKVQFVDHVPLIINLLLYSSEKLRQSVAWMNVMANVTLSWRMLFFHGDCYSFMANVILSWRMLLFHGECYWMLLLHLFRSTSGRPKESIDQYSLQIGLGHHIMCVWFRKRV